jgi:hypothetical protein
MNRQVLSSIALSAAALLLPMGHSEAATTTTSQLPTRFTSAVHSTTKASTRRSGTAAAARAPERSTNWSGYVAYTTVHSVEATWTLPSYPAQQNLPTWVGIGGDGNCDSVVQAGTSHWMVNGHEQYMLWWETYDPTAQKPPMNVNVPPLMPGQQLRIQVSIQGHTATFNYWVDGAYTEVQSHVADLGLCGNTGDFVVEAVDGHVPFGQMHWSHCLVNGKPLGGYAPVPVILVDGKQKAYTAPQPVQNDSFNLEGW